MSCLPSDVTYYLSSCMPSYDGSTTLNGAIASTSATTFTLTSAASFPSSGEFAVQIDSEIIWVTQISGTAVNGCIRGMFGTTAATHSNGANVTMPAGGPINILGKPSFSQVGSGDTVDIVSTSASDTLVKILNTGRDTTGVLKTETLTANGRTAVTGAQAWGRITSSQLAAVTTLNGALTAGATSVVVTTGAALPSSGTIQVGLELISFTSNTSGTLGGVTRHVGGTTATAHASGDNVYLLPVGDIIAYDHTKFISAHTAQTGSANPTGSTPALMKLQSGDGATVAVGQVIHTTGGTGPNQAATIIATSGYGTDVVAVSRSWGTVPDNTTTYDVLNGVQFDFSPNQITAVQMVHSNAQADVAGGSARNFYEKLYVVNNNTTTAAIAQSGQSAVTIDATGETASLPSGATIFLATATAQNDTVAWATRQTAPGSGYGTLTSQPANVNLGANSGNLASGAAPNTAGAQGVVVQLQLNAGTAPYLGAITYLQTNFATT